MPERMSRYEHLPRLLAVANSRAERDGRRRRVKGQLDERGQWRYVIEVGEGRRRGGRWERPARHAQ